MSLPLVAKALLLLVFLGAVAGATFGVQLVLDPEGEGRAPTGLAMQPVRRVVNATPGHTVTFPIALTNGEDAPRTVTLVASGPAGSGRSLPVVVPARGSSVAFVPVAVPTGTPAGDAPVHVAIQQEGVPDRVREGFVKVSVRAAGPGLPPGGKVDVVYTGRIADTGRVFSSNDVTLAPRPFARTESYRFSQGLLTVDTSTTQVLPGVLEGIGGIQPGESRTLTFGPEKGYGDGMDEQTEPREDRLPRTFTLTTTCTEAEEAEGACGRRRQTVPRAEFDRWVRETRQGEPSAVQVGDKILFGSPEPQWPYNVTAIGPSSVEIVLEPSYDANYTLYAFWPGRSVLKSMNETTVVLETNPTHAIGENFTARGYWPEMSSVAEITNDTIVVRHSPPVGLAFTRPTQTGNVRATVADVTPTTIVTTVPTGDPLAGLALTFDIEAIAFRS